MYIDTCIFCICNTLESEAVTSECSSSSNDRFHGEVQCTARRP
jgi:hypothetical protein